jgi:hypothetical protein
LSQPEAVAEAIVAAARQPQRDVYVPGILRALPVLEAIAPSLLDTVMLRRDLGFSVQISDELPAAADTLFESPGASQPVHGGWRMTGRREPPARQRSAPRLTRQHVLLGAAALGGVLLLRRGR